MATAFTTILAKTDLAGCTSSATVKDGGYYALWWVPETGEICSGIDCGGGRAPPKYNVPGCAAYTGSLEYEPSYMPGWGPDGKEKVVETTSAKPVQAEETTKAAAPAVTSKAVIPAQPVVSPSGDVAVSTADSEEEVGMSIQTETSVMTSAPSMPKATGTGMVTSKVASSIVLDSSAGNSTSDGNGTKGNGTAPVTGAASQAAVGFTFMGAMALLAAAAI